MTIKTFTTATTEITTAEEREKKIAELVKEKIAAGQRPEQAQEEAEAEAPEADEYVEFQLDQRKMKAYKPTSGQLVFMMAAMGRGQTKDARFGAIVNILMESLDEDDQDYLESRMISRKRSERIEPKDLESIFEYLMEQWFATPTQEQ